MTLYSLRNNNRSDEEEEEIEQEQKMPLEEMRHCKIN
jgi:hypothetical protein